MKRIERKTAHLQGRVRFQIGQEIKGAFSEDTEDGGKHKTFVV